VYDTSSLAQALADYFYPHLAGIEDLGKHLEHVEVNLRSATEEAISINLERFDDDISKQVPSDWKVLDRPRRTIIALVGEISYCRRVYLDSYGCRRYLLDEILAINPYQRIEANAFLWIVYKAADVSYEKTRKAFLNKTGVDIGRTTVMRCVHKCGELLVQAEKTNDLPISAPVVFSEFDGFWINLQAPTKKPARPRRTYKEQFKKKSKEMKVWVAYAGIKNSKRAHPVHWASDSEPQEFFQECMASMSSVYDPQDIEYLVTGSDGAAWCKNHKIEDLSEDSTTVLSKLDTFHVNQKLYRAFSGEEDRSTYLGYLYARDFESFFKVLEKRLEDEPNHERTPKRQELYTYVSNNLDWLDNMTLSEHLRETLRADLPAVFGDRSFCVYLDDLLTCCRYKRFLDTLERIVATCKERLRYDYENYLNDAKHNISCIALYRPTKLGTIEGTNAKVYAARLKVWGCAWSERGALAMMRIRAAIHSGKKLPAPVYDPWLTKREKEKIEASKTFSFQVPEKSGDGYTPPQGTMCSTVRIAPKLYGAINFSRDLLPQWCI
jgi:hypothetical protein